MGPISETEIRSGEPPRRLAPLTRETVPSIRAIAAHSFSTVWKEEEFLHFLNHPAGLCLGLWVGEELAAYFIGLVAADELDIVSIATAPAFRRRGLAGELLEVACGRANRAYLEVAVDNAEAIALYRKEGFSIVGLRKKYYAAKTDALVMRRPA